jgi:hypothetical protein
MREIMLLRGRLPQKGGGLTGMHTWKRKKRAVDSRRSKCDKNLEIVIY